MTLVLDPHRGPADRSHASRQVSATPATPESATLESAAPESAIPESAAPEPAAPESVSIPQPRIRPFVPSWNSRSIALLLFSWLVLQFGGIFSPGLLDDVDSMYIEVAREMLQRHDFVTPYIDGIRFFDKPPLMYWMAAGSMKLFGVSAWAARLPLALAVLALLLSVYALGNRLFAAVSPAASPDRGGFYSALALATAIGPYLYTRFFIPDILIALWMTLGIHLFLIALQRTKSLQTHRLDQSDGTDRAQTRHVDPGQFTARAEQRHLDRSRFLARAKKRYLDLSQFLARAKQRHPDLSQFLARAKQRHLDRSRFLARAKQRHLDLSRFLARAKQRYLDRSQFLARAKQRHPDLSRFLARAKQRHLDLSQFLARAKRRHLDRSRAQRGVVERPPHLPSPSPTPHSSLLPCLAFAAVLALNLLTKGFIGLVFPVAFVLLYLALTRQLRLLPRFHPLASAAVFLAIAAPWHILVALRNPAIPLPPNLGLPARGGWTWFYLYNEHIARFFSRRIPHDYGQTPVWLFWLYLAVWVMPWTTFLPAAMATQLSALRRRASATAQEYETALTLMLWSVIVLGFFTVSARQEYYSLPAVPAFALMAGGLLARADSARSSSARVGSSSAARGACRWSIAFLVPVTTITAALCAYFAIAAPRVAAGVTLSGLLANDRSFYNVSLGHLFDLTGPAMGLFRRPLAAVAVGMVAVGLGSTLLRRKGRSYAANLTLAAGMIVTLLAAHAGLARFYPVLGSKDLAASINAVIQPNDLILIDSEVTYGSTLIFYTGRQVHVVDGHINGLWYGSFWPDAPQVFETEASLHTLWAGPRHIFLLTYNPDRRRTLASLGLARILAASGGKTILTNFIPPQPHR